MYWHDYDIGRRSRLRGHRLALALLGLVIGALLGGALNEWWPLPLLTTQSRQASVAAADVSATSAVALATESSSRHTPGERPETSAQTPRFALPDLFNDTVTRSLDDYAGQPVILNFWASWCVPCRTEMPALQRVHVAHQDKGLVILGINQTYVDSLDEARDFVTGLELTFPNVRDDSGTVSERAYHVLGLPTTVFIGRDGKIVVIRIGQLSQAQMETFSRRILARELPEP